jgi:DNA-binding CsgD family transcriptional regulator
MNPAGLNDNSIEIYLGSAGELKALCNGNSFDYKDLPSVLREPFQAELISDTPATNCIIKEMKITDTDEMELKFVACRYGRLDGTPDLKDGILTSTVPQCDKVDNCPGYGIVCKAPEGINGKLSKREYMIVIEIAKGKLDKEIAHKLGIELTTVRTYLTRIREKLCVNNRIEIALWAQRKSIV